MQYCRGVVWSYLERSYRYLGRAADGLPGDTGLHYCRHLLPAGNAHSAVDVLGLHGSVVDGMHLNTCTQRC
jgi:hypothetical protein